jgi:hypothetical protein
MQMGEENIIEGEATAIPVEAKPVESKAPDRKAAVTAVKDAVGSLGKAVASALQDRAHVIMVRVNDDALRHMDMLIQAEVTKSRPESAAFLITAGIEANQALFNRISSVTEQITTLRTQLREMIKPEE